MNLRIVARTVKLGLLMAALSLAACAGIQVTTDYDTSRQFSTLTTYAWMEPNKKLIIDPLVDNGLMNKRVQRSVEAELAALGFVKAEGDKGADFFITYHVSAETKLSVTSFHGSYGYYPCWGGCTVMDMGTAVMYRFGNISRVPLCLILSILLRVS